MAGDEKQLAFVGIARAARLRAPVRELLGGRRVRRLAVGPGGCPGAQCSKGQGTGSGHRGVLPRCCEVLCCGVPPVLKLQPEQAVKALFIGHSEFAQDNACMFWMTHRAFAGRHNVRGAAAAWVVSVFALAALPASASGKDDHEQARQAVQAGQVLPLPAVLERLQREVPGQVLEVELEQKQSGWIYEIKLLTPAGQLTKVKLDARTAEVLRIKPRDDHHPARENR